MAAREIRGRSFFILCCARSGSTSLARILDAGSNATCAVEPMPNLAVESRRVMDGARVDAKALIEQAVVPRVTAGLRSSEIYGEKNVTYGPFVRELWERLGCRFVFLHRDGRDVVRSLVDWHEQLFGDVYRESADPGELSARALEAAAALPAWRDTSDYARPRPRPGEPLYASWASLPREAMCAYYWSRINALYAEQLAALPRDAWMALDYTRASRSDVLRVAEFLGVKGLSAELVGEMLEGRINSLGERGELEGRFPDWRCWDGGQRGSFEEIAGAEMARLGYWSDEATRWRPEGYGHWWSEDRGGLDWYEWMYRSRERMHQEMIDWVHARDGAEARIERILDIGCGLGVGYADAFSDRRYVGVDLSEWNVRWCRQNRAHPRHDYWQIDVIADEVPERFELVSSSGTIDNAYDIDRFLTGMVRASSRWIYLTAYRGWFPDLSEHRYRWSDEHGCFYADISPRRVRAHLEQLGCRDIHIEPRRTDRGDIAAETRITARVPKGDG